MIQKYRAFSEQYGMREVIGLYWFDEYIKVTLKNGISSPIRACTRFVKLMQSTGLRDKNGVEIFAGDIIEVHLKKGNLTFRVAQGCTQFVAFMGNLSNTLIEVIEDLEINDDFYEVIGNIYENPELVEG